MEGEFYYEWGLSEEQKQRIKDELGATALSLPAYVHAREEIRSIDVDMHVLFEVKPESKFNGE